MKNKLSFAILFILFSCSSPGLSGSDVARSWLQSMKIEYSGVTCTPEHKTGCESGDRTACYVRITNGEIATIYCENSEKDSSGCRPAEGNDQVILSRAPIKSKGLE